MPDQVTALLYLLMRDHLPSGTVKEVVEHAKLRDGTSPTLLRLYSAPELQALAERYGAELLGDDVQIGPDPSKDLDDAEPARSLRDDLADLEADQPAAPATDDEAEARREHRRRSAPHTRPEPRPKKRVSDETVAETLAYIVAHGKVKPGELDEQVGFSTSTRARVLKILRQQRKLEAFYVGKQRYLRAVTASTGVHGVGEDSPPAPGQEDPPDDESVPGQNPDEPLDPPAPDDGAGGDGSVENSSDLADSKNGSAGSGDQAEDVASVSTNPPVHTAPGGADPSKPPMTAVEAQRLVDEDLADAFMRVLDAAGGAEVWPTEVQRAIGVEIPKLKRLATKLVVEGRLVQLGGAGERVRFRSAKAKRAAPPAPRRDPADDRGATPEPIGSGPTHLKDHTADRNAAAAIEGRRHAREAHEQVTFVGEWAKGAGTFTARKVRETFDLEAAVISRILAALAADGVIHRVGEQAAGTWESVRAERPRSSGSKRPLSAGADGSTLEGRALGILSATPTSLVGIAAKLGVSEDVAKPVMAKLFCDGDVRPQRVGDAIVYATTT